MEKETYVTLATSDFYAYGCIVLGHSLRKSGTGRKLVALVTNDVSWNISQLLQSVFDYVERIPKLNLDYEFQGVPPDFSSSLAKLHCWRLTQFTKGVFLNADTLVLQNCDELFERSELSAVPDVGWPDCFNSGVFIFEPSLETYWSLINLLKERWHRDGGDQYILNLYFNPDWKNDISKRLPFIYNLVCSSIYTYTPAFQQFGKQVKIAHFVGHPKPWDSVWNSKDCQMTLPNEINHTFRPFHHTWMEIFKQEVYPRLSKFKMIQDPDRQQVPLMPITSPQISHSEEHAQRLSHSYNTTSYSASPIFNPESYESFPESPLTSTPRIQFTKSFEERSECLVSSPQHTSFSPKTKQIELKPNPLLEKEKVSKSLETFESTISRFKPVNSEHVPYNRLQISSQPSDPQSFPSEINSNDKQPNIEINYKTQSIHSESSYNTLSSPSKISPRSESAPPEMIHEIQSTLVENDHYTSSSSSKTVKGEQVEDKLLDDEEMRMKRWEEGEIDYLGQDTFDNIWKHLSSIIEETPKEIISKNTEPNKTLIQIQLVPEAQTKKTKTDESISDIITTLSNAATAVATSAKLEDEEDILDNTITFGKNKIPGYPLDDYTGMYEWEQGRIDYTGKDSSENIIQRLDFLIKHKDYRDLLKESIPVTTY